MKYAIIVSNKDLAGLNIKEQLINDYNFLQYGKKFDNNAYSLGDIKLYTVDEKTILSENIDKEIDEDILIFASRHLSKAKEHSLCCHTPGNWDSADYGGKEKTLCVCPANFQKHIFKILNKEGKDHHSQITLEVTHHGPELDKPAVYIEIGSDEKEWQNPKAGKILARTIMEAINTPVKEFQTAIGIGGTHYAANFNKIQLESDIALSHICPKYMLEKLDKKMIQKAIERTTPKPNLIILDWKGLSTEKQRIITILEELNIPYKRTKEI